MGFWIYPQITFWTKSPSWRNKGKRNPIFTTSLTGKTFIRHISLAFHFIHHYHPPTSLRWKLNPGLPHSPVSAPSITSQWGISKQLQLISVQVHVHLLNCDLPILYYSVLGNNGYQGEKHGSRGHNAICLELKSTLLATWANWTKKLNHSHSYIY